MSIFSAFNSSASALTAQRLRMDVISSNTANAQTTRAKVNENGEYEPYRRKLLITAANEQSFGKILNKVTHKQSSIGTGVKVTNIVEDQAPFNIIFDPTHPDAGEDGYVAYPNVDPLKEMVDLMGANRSYEANVTALNASKGILLKALEIGK